MPNLHLINHMWHLRNYQLIILFLFTRFTSISLPPPPLKTPVNENSQSVNDDYDISARHYHPYLTKVIEILSADPHGQNMLESLQMDQVDLALRNFTSHFRHRSKEAYEQLNQLKVDELERLRHLINNQKDLPRDITDHIDVAKPHFDDSDLIKLLQKAISDIDLKRREAFKYYEMEKQYNETKMKKNMSKEEIADLEKKKEIKEEKLESELKKNPIHEPGSKEQYEEVAHDIDELDNFDPKSFFQIHDLDGNGFWDQSEISALVQREVEKKYPLNDPEMDPIERNEFAETLESDLMNDVDKNKDTFISYKEFIEDYNEEELHPEPNERHREKTTLYTHQEYENMIKEKEVLFKKQHSTLNFEQLSNHSQNEAKSSPLTPKDHLKGEQDIPNLI